MSWKDRADKSLAEKKKAKEASQKIPSIKVQDMITELEEYETRWSKWESGFINDIQLRLDEDQFLSENQCDKILELYDRYCGSGASRSSRVKDRPRYNI